MIQPTPGRVVWYYPSPRDTRGQYGDTPMVLLDAHDRLPLAAHVVAVHNERLVNLAVFDAMGNLFRREGVQLLQGENDAPVGPDDAHCAWMPYQQAQAAKHAAPVAPIPASDFKDRVRLERTELADKVDKLGVFICSPRFDKVMYVEQERLRRQHTAMQQYLNVLDERIASF